MIKPMWIAVLAGLTLAVSACEQEKVPQAREGNEKIRIRESLTQKEKEILPNIADEEAPPTLPQPISGRSDQMPLPAAAAPSMVTYDASPGQVTFNHEAHADRLDCVECHAGDPPQKMTLGKDKAHELCSGCHREMGGGPTQCAGCHKKRGT